jgi:membrane associated rhomboid family serine protease
VALLACCALVLGAAGGFGAGLPLSQLLTFGAKATSLIFDRGETWRLLAANLLHKDALHLACNAFVLWNVGGALERAVRPADYLATLLYTALGTTLASAMGADSVSLGASGMAFGVLGASASFGWRRGVHGHLRKHFGLRLLPWLLALFGVGLGSSGVDNWGHAGGLSVGLFLGLFLEPRPNAAEGPSRRLAAALGAAAAALGVGAVAAPFLPLLGTLRDGPAEVQLRVPLGWRRVADERDRVSFTNGLTGGFRSAATLWVGPPLARRRGASGCGDLGALVRGMVERDLWRLMDSGPPLRVDLAMRLGAGRLAGQPAGRLEGVVTSADGAARVTALCTVAPSLGNAAVAVIALSSEDDAARLAERVAGSVRLPE